MIFLFTPSRVTVTRILSLLHLCNAAAAAAAGYVLLLGVRDKPVLPFLVVAGADSDEDNDSDSNHDTDGDAVMSNEEEEQGHNGTSLSLA